MMTYLATFFIYFLNIINSIKKRKSKILIFAFIVLLLILMGGNTKNPDYYSYEILYYNYGNVVSADFGYRILCAIFRNLGINYEGFRIIISLIGFYLINITIKKYSANKIFVYLLYAIYPFLLDVVQIRNFLMTSIVIYAMSYLVKKSGKSTIKYILFILIASSIHITALVYLPIALILYLDKNIFFKLFIFYIIIIGILAGINKDILEIIANKIINALDLDDSRFIMYSSIKTQYGYLLYWSLQFLTYAIIKSSKSICNKNKLVDEHKNKFVDLVYVINLYLLIFLPFYVFEITYHRFARNMMILNYIVYTITYQSIVNNKYKKLIYLSFIILLVLMHFALDIFIPQFDNIIKPIFEFNWILN